eukprot:2837622-Rhodomonas_salina.1
MGAITRERGGGIEKGHRKRDCGFETNWFWAWERGFGFGKVRIGIEEDKKGAKKGLRAKGGGKS